MSGTDRFRIFVLGDSKTGTTSISYFLQDLGFKSIHYYIEDANILTPAHIEFYENWKRLKRFIDNSSYQAFSDYPTRLFYKELAESFPNSRFILNVREIGAWKSSAQRYFNEKRALNVDIDNLTKVYARLNAQIEGYFSGDFRFMKLEMEKDDEEKSELLKRFLRVESNAKIRKLHIT